MHCDVWRCEQRIADWEWEVKDVQLILEEEIQKFQMELEGALLHEIQETGLSQARLGGKLEEGLREDWLPPELVWLLGTHGDQLSSVEEDEGCPLDPLQQTRSLETEPKNSPAAGMWFVDHPEGPTGGKSTIFATREGGEEENYYAQKMELPAEMLGPNNSADMHMLQAAASGDLEELKARGAEVVFHEDGRTVEVRLDVEKALSSLTAELEQVFMKRDSTLIFLDPAEQESQPENSSLKAERMMQKSMTPSSGFGLVTEDELTEFLET